jgi:hypothetical protein
MYRSNNGIEALALLTENPFSGRRHIPGPEHAPDEWF